MVCLWKTVDELSEYVLKMTRYSICVASLCIIGAWFYCCRGPSLSHFRNSAEHDPMVEIHPIPKLLGEYSTFSYIPLLVKLLFEVADRIMRHHLV
jgi:hypothetical protein